MNDRSSEYVDLRTLVVNFKLINKTLLRNENLFLPTASWYEKRKENWLDIVYPFSNIDQSLWLHDFLLYGISSWNFMHLGRLNPSRNVFKNTPFVPAGWACEVSQTPQGFGMAAFQLRFECKKSIEYGIKWNILLHY